MARYLIKDTLEERDDEASQEPTPSVAVLRSELAVRRRAEAALRENEHPFRALLDNSKAVIYIKDLAGRYLFINRQFEKIFGVRQADFLGKTDYDLQPAAVADYIRDNDLSVIKAGTALELEEVIPGLPEHEARTYISVKEPLFDADGRPYAVCGISTDITERKRVEESLRLGEERYRSLVEASAAIVWNTPAGGEFEAAQPDWSDFTGQTFEQLRGWGWLEAVHPDDRENTSRVWSHAVASRTTYHIEHRVLRHDGEYRDMAARGVPIVTSDGSLREWVGAHVDITDKRQAEKALRESRERHAAAMAASGTGTYRWDLQTGAMEWDDQMRVLHGVPPDFTPCFKEYMRMIHPDDLPCMMGTTDHCREHGDTGSLEFRIIRPDGSVRWLSGQGKTYYHDDGRPSHTIGGCFDITKLKRAEERLAHRATHDALTGMPNRGFLQSEMEARIASTSEEDDQFALLLLDLDRFKEINDTFGHHHGDAVLQELKPRFTAAVGKSGLVARFGGDEFGILLRNADRAEAEATAQRILTSLEQPIFVDGHVLEVGASIGIALFPEHSRDAATLTRLADIAMYTAKRACCGSAVYEEEQNQFSPRRLAMVGELRQAIEHDQLVLYYQPKIDLKTMQPAGAEALIRWNHPRDGLLAPGVFIPLAEETGLIRPLSLWVLNRALRDSWAWVREGLVPNIAINLAPDSLQDLDLAETVVELLDRYGVAPNWLTIEVTETAMMKNPTQAKAVLQSLHERGVQISIDDFGTGYSSLAYLKELPVDEIKVDRSFVKDMAHNERDACIVRSVIDLGHNLGLRVVAEGVENLATLKLLGAWGCDLAQGYNLSPPLPASHVAAWIDDRITPQPLPLPAVAKSLSWSQCMARSLINPPHFETEMQALKSRRINCKA